jgi:hypothetical protein
MSRYNLDPPDDDAYDVHLQANATCTDCGADYVKALIDPTTWCDSCSDRRDRWVTAQEIRTMVTAVLRVDLTTVKDVA